MKKYLTIACALCFLGCVNAKSNIKEEVNAMKLDNNEYQISAIIDKKTEKEYSAMSNWSIVLEDDKFGMYVGCNRIFGGIKQANGKLEYQNTASTKMMCPMMDVENLVLQNLNSMKIIENGLENENIKIIFK